MKLPLAIHKDPGTEYGVTVPGVPGCFSSGETIDEAIASAEEAIASHIRICLELNDPIDVSTDPIDAYLNNPDYAGAIWALAEVDLSILDNKPERFNVSMPRLVLSRIDSYAEAHHETRSGFLARAALDLMAREHRAA